jgi:hypothetical protein
MYSRGWYEAAQRNATRPPGERPHAAPAESSNELIEIYKNTAQSFLSQQACAHCGQPIDAQNYIEQGALVFHPACVEARRREGNI